MEKNWYHYEWKKRYIVRYIDKKVCFVRLIK